MLCEDDGMPLQWRCTNLENNVSKYKCPHCGRLYLIVEPEIEQTSDKLEKPKYYHKTPYGTFTIHRRNGGDYRYFGTYPTREIAAAVVEKLKEYDWDKSCLPNIRDELGLVRKGKQWVWT